MADFIDVEGERYDALGILKLKGALKECLSHRVQNVNDFFLLFNDLYKYDLSITEKIQRRLATLAGTTLLEAAYIMTSIKRTTNISGDWCEYGVAQGKTSALLAELLLCEDLPRSLWLYDSFEGLPEPHEKDVLLHDIFGKKEMSAYKGAISIPEQYVINELRSVKEDFQDYKIIKGWITAESLRRDSPQEIAFAYLDMDFYQSTFDVLEMLVDRMPPGGIAVVDDYGFFSEGVKTAVAEIMDKHPKAFSVEHPYNAKFILLTRRT